MEKILLGLAVVSLMIVSCSQYADNPFFSEWDTPYQVPPFDKIKTEHYMPALIAGLEREQAEIDNIAANPETPSFANTIEAYEAAGQFLAKVENVFYNLSATDANDDFDQIDQEFTPLRSKHSDNILLNAELFERIKYVHANTDRENLTVEQNTLLDKVYQDFLRNGANLDNDQKARLREVNEDLSILTMEFGRNIRKENEKWEMVIEDESELAGLPERVIMAAAKVANERGHEGKWLFTLDKPSWIPFLQNSPNRALRKKIYDAYTNRGDNNDDLDNNVRIVDIVNLRLERANMLGYSTHADYVLERSMAGTTENVYNLLDKLWKPSLQRAQLESGELKSMISRENEPFPLNSSDWWYYAEKIRKEKYDLDETQLRPYFEVDKVRDGAFAVAEKLFGITLTERFDIPVYHKDVHVFDVKEADGTHIGVFYTDYHPRRGKQVGAWASSFRSQSNRNGDKVTPVVINVGNFTAPAGDLPALISFSEVETLFHEFGHALHSLLRNRVYTNQIMPRDFVELPSQIMENWASEPEVLKSFAKHYKTGEVIPDELIKKIQSSRLHNQGFAMTEYLAASILDMDWHTMEKPNNKNPTVFENESFAKMELIPEIVSRYRSTYFKHIFSGGYSAGYYSYVWAQVLDADAFEAFKEKGLYDQELAARYRKYILGLSGTMPADEIYRKFRGRDPEIAPFLDRRGLSLVESN